ncbi:MAG: AAA family ATPase [Nitrospira sp.]|nr:AAA family ATPase [Nitrospira sp.]
MQNRLRSFQAGGQGSALARAVNVAGQLKGKAASLLASPEVKSVPESVAVRAEEQFTPLEEVASVSGRFDPTELAKALNLEGDSKMSSLGGLASFCSVETVEQGTFWLLHGDRRSACLQRLSREQRIRAVLDGPLPPTTPQGEMLRKILRGDSIALDGLTHEELLAVSWSLEAVAGLDIAKPSAAEVRQRLARAQFLAGYEGLGKNFVGREEELATLNAFIQTKEPGGHLLLLSGLGGAGKSTLLAKFAHETAQAGRATVVVLDFDRPGIDGRDTVWLEMEMARQVGAQYPQHDQMLRQAREDVRHNSMEVRHAQDSSSSNSSESERGFSAGVLEPIAGVLKEVELGRPFLLILDTFEEVAQRELTGKILDWLEQVYSMLQPTSVCAVISGRVFEKVQRMVEWHHAQHIALDEFSPPTTEVFLRSQGVEDKAAARLAASDVLPRRPLELKLVAKLIAGSPASAVESLERDLRSGGAAAKELFAGLVYRRVLLRISVPKDQRVVDGFVITDELLRTLAYPGLVLRYVTPALVQKVLAPALGLPELTERQAAAALEMLAKHEWLAYRQHDEVWPRRDLRRSVLKPMLAEDLQRTKRIQDLAIAYFEASPTDRERAEALYHHLMRTTSRQAGASFNLDALRKARTFIEVDRTDLPPAGEALFQFAVQGEVEVEKVRLLPRAYREPAYHAKGRSLLKAREFGLGLQLYHHSNNLLADWELTLLLSTGKWDELRSRLGETPDFRNLPGWGEYLFAAAVAKSPLLGKLDTLRLPKSDKTLLNYGFGTSLQMLSMGLVMGAKGEGLPPRLRKGLISALPRFEMQAKTDPVVGKRLIFLKLLLKPTSIKKLQISPSTISLDPRWLMQAPDFLGECGKVPDRAREWFKTLRELAQEKPASMWDTRAFLSHVQKQKETFVVPVASARVRRKALWRYLDGPNPEFRDPARFALLAAFPTAKSYHALAALLKSIVPYPLKDLEPEAFTRAVEASPEHALQPYVELVDRVGKLPFFLRKAMALSTAAGARKLKAVANAINRWRTAARKTVLPPTENKQKHKTKRKTNNAR